MGEVSAYLKKRGKVTILVLTGCLIMCVLISASMGFIKVSLWDVLKILFLNSSTNGASGSNMDKVIPNVIYDVRLPRILASAVVGAGLSIAGVIFQGILLNPLADPYTLGISAGAGFGASIALLFNITFAGNYSVSLFAFMGALGTLVAVIFLSLRQEEKDLSSNTLILAGIIVSAILSAGISFMKYMADEHVSVIIFWLMGSFASRTWSDVLFGLFTVLGGGLVCLLYAGDLNILSLGSRSAISLGVRANQVRIILLVTASMITATCVSVSGIIGFVGLIIPHLMRFFTGADNRLLIPASALAGAILLLMADTVTRAVLPGEIPIGVLTALIGGPIFCYIFKKRYEFQRKD